MVKENQVIVFLPLLLVVLEVNKEVMEKHLGLRK
jgi:hypothetical protein